MARLVGKAGEFIAASGVSAPVLSRGPARSAERPPPSGLPPEPGSHPGGYGRIRDVTSFGVPSVSVEAVPAEFDQPPGEAAGAVLLDVREDDEWQLGHAPGAVHIPLSDVPARYGELDPDADLYVICRQGGRSLEAVKYLVNLGYEAVNVVGGMVAWQQRGRPLTAEGDEPAKIY